MKAFIIFAFIALAFGQSQQYGPIVPIQTIAGTAAIGTLLPTTVASAYHVNSYAVWIPATAYSVNLTATATDSNCYYLDIFVSAVVAPCSFYDYESSGVYTACSDSSQTSYTDFTTSGVIVTIDGRSGYNLFRPGQWLYYSIGREDSLDNTATCGYSVTTSIYNCANGSLPGVNSNYEEACFPYTVVAANTSFTANVATITGNGGSPLVFAAMVGLNNAYVHVQVNSSSSALEITGQEAGVDASYDYICIDASSTNVGNFYIYDLYCYSVRPGMFVIDMINQQENFTSTVHIMPVYCPGNMGGMNCSFPVMAFNATSLSTFSVYIPADNGAYTYAYFYIDFPANSTFSTQFTIMMTQNIAGSQSYFYPYFNAYPNYEEDRFDYYETVPSAYEITAFDFVAGQRLYLALDCETTTACNVSVSFNISTVATTGMNNQMTTGPAAATTGRMATTGPAAVTTGPAAVTTMQRFTTSKITSGVAGMTTSAPVSSSSVVIPSIFAIFALLALLF